MYVKEFNKNWHLEETYYFKVEAEFVRKNICYADNYFIGRLDVVLLNKGKKRENLVY